MTTIRRLRLFLTSYRIALLGVYFVHSHSFSIHHNRGARRNQINRLLDTHFSGVGNGSDAEEEVPHVVVVGGGVGGLAIAARIASSRTASSRPPCKVTILEKNERMGGRCGSFTVDVSGHGTFRHERGPSLLLLPLVYRDLFLACGSDAKDCGLEIKQCVPAYQVVFDDGDRLNVGFPRQDGIMSQGEQESRNMMDSFEPNGALKWDAYMHACEAFLDCGLPNFIEQKLDLASFPSFLRESMRDFCKAWPLKPHSDVLDALFQSDKMRALASFQDLYVGLEPYRNDKLFGGGVFESTAPAIFGLLAAIELHPTNQKCGVFAPIGGFQKVTDSFENLARGLGVSLECGKTVTKVTNDGVYFCSSLGSTEYMPADLIVVNADLPYARQSLLRNEGSDPSLIVYDWAQGEPGRTPYRFSSGVIAFHWSLSKELSDLNTHNVMVSASSRLAAEVSWKVLRDNEIPPTLSAFNFYVHRASKTDPTASPKGHDAILVLVPTETLFYEPECCQLPREEAIAKYQEQFDKARLDQVRQAVLRRLSAIESLRDLESHILDEVVETPATYADSYNLAAGSPFALSHGLAQLSIARPGAASATLPSVIMVGASSRPGNGVPLVLVGAKLAADLAIRKLASLSKI